MRIGSEGRHFRLFAVGGLIASCVAVVGGGQTVTPTTVASTSWFGLLAAHGPGSTHGVVFGFVLFAALVALVVLWFGAVHSAERGRLSERRIWLLGAVWAAPFVAGPPIISKDVHAYAAQGILAHHGLDPYSSNVLALTHLNIAAADHAVAAVDPQWRASLSPYGPFATFLERAAADLTDGNPVGTVVVLRVAAVLSVAAMCLAAAALGRPRRTVAIACVLLNPLVLVHGVSGAHFEAEMGALVMAGVLAAKRRSWVLAILLICAAGSVKAPAFAVLPIVIAAHVHQRAGHATSRSQGLLLVMRDVAISVGGTAVIALSVPNGLGWVRNLSTPSQSSTASVAGGVEAFVRMITPHTWSAGARAAVSGVLLLVAIIVIVRLVLGARGREVEASAGVALVALALLAPVFYPWYLLWGATCWLVAARPERRNQLLALCGVATVLAATGTPADVARNLDLAAAIVAIGWLRYRANVAHATDPSLVTTQTSRLIKDPKPPTRA